MRISSKPPPACSLLVLSCDAYSDLWTPFFSLLDSHWFDCPYRKYLGTGEQKFVHNEVSVLHSNAGKDWSSCLLDYLGKIETEYVLVMLDDFFLRSKVDTVKIERCVNFAIAHRAHQIRLIPRPGPTKKINGERLLGLCEAGMRYRVSTQSAIWNRQALAQLLKPGESAWDFEHNATARSHAEPNGHYAVWKPVLPYQGLLAHHVIEKGCWLPHEKMIFSTKPIGCDFSRREVLSWGRTLQCHTASLVIWIISLLPYSISRSVRKLLRKVAQRVAPAQLERLSGRGPKRP